MPTNETLACQRRDCGDCHGFTDRTCEHACHYESESRAMFDSLTMDERYALRNKLLSAHTELHNVAHTLARVTLDTLPPLSAPGREVWSQRERFSDAAFELGELIFGELAIP